VELEICAGFCGDVILSTAQHPASLADPIFRCAPDDSDANRD